ncbi:MAG TPA: glycosyltransferase [Blastocatellia bacterium]|nr:glycosyltransferase [Blastocatellia bacterium]
MIYVFYVLARILLLQGLVSLLEGIRFLKIIRRAQQEYPVPFTPMVSIIAPCKGVDNGMAENLRALFNQDYPKYEIVFAIASNADPARGVIERVMAQRPDRTARLVVADRAGNRSEKINNLLCALQHVSPDAEAFAFVDSDAQVRSDWLRSLVSPLADTQVGAATGYRWYLPEMGGFWSAALSAWNGSVATTLGDDRRNFAWGGSTAILRQTFDMLNIAKHWQGAVSDDYALTRAVHDAGLGLRFAPRCLVVSREDATFKSLLEFTTRQVVITRVYRPASWWVGMVSSALFCAVFFGGSAFTLGLAIGGANIAIPSIMLAAIYLVGSVKGVLRLSAAREAIPSARNEIMRLWWMYCLLWPLISLIFLMNFITSATTRRILWRGVCYEMRSPTETVIIR